MDKKLQIFVSSTFKDMQDERQAAVEAILSAGHIPAGMELFCAGNESQLEVIKRWIDDSDVYLLILGGRYGTVETITQKSYIQLEFEYAVKKNKPLFSLVISEAYLDKKVKDMGKDILELSNPDKYKTFKKIVTSKIVEFFDDIKDIKLSIHKTLRDFEKHYEFDGWISGKNILDSTELIKQNSTLMQENSSLKDKVEYLTALKDSNSDDIDFQNIEKELTSLIIPIPINMNDVFGDNTSLSTFDICKISKFVLLKGITTATNATELEQFLFREIAPKLLLFGLMKEKNLYGKSFVRYVVTEKGADFFRKHLN